MSQPQPPPKTVEETLLATPTVRDLTGLTLGDFEVERLLGVGGMGEVYLAKQLSLDRPVALKVLRPEMLVKPTSLARFESEAWAAAKLNHPNVVHIYTLGSIEGRRFIAMEYVAGTNLREYLVKKGPPELPVALSIMKQAAQAVGAAGEMGLIHRDIKPENLLLTKKGQVKVADFGLCRGPESDTLHLTQPGVTIGTPMYMSPEQVQGHAMDHRSDLYSLGVTFYHMLAGVPPFRAETALALAVKHVREVPVSLGVHRPDLHPDLVRLVMKLLEKKPADRPQSAAEVLRDLARVRDAIQAVSGTAAVTETAPIVSEIIPEPTRQAWRWPAVKGLRIDRRLLVAVGMIGLFLGAWMGWRARVADLLSDGASTPDGPPALWMANWKRVPRRASAQDQYRYAQTRAPEADREAAWLAVAGHFPTAEKWASDAYTQLARQTFRRGDAARLDALAADLARSGRAHDQTLAQIARAGASALRDDAQEVLSRLGGVQPLNLPPDLAELALEVVLRAAKGRGVAASEASSLRRLRGQLLANLRIDLIESLDLLRVE